LAKIFPYWNVFFETTPAEYSKQFRTKMPFGQQGEDDGFSDQVAFGFRIEVDAKKHFVGFVTQRSMMFRQPTQKQHVAHSASEKDH
jgi:hypothetical protein